MHNMHNETSVSKFKLRLLRWLLRDRDIYDICSALRGPDNRDLDLKDNTTAIVRAIVMDANNPRQYDIRIAHTDLYGGEFRARLVPPDHFVSHQKSAFRALGLNWFGDNAIPKRR